MNPMDEISAQVKAVLLIDCTTILTVLTTWISSQVKAGVKLRKSGEMMRLTNLYTGLHAYDKYHHTHNTHHNTPRTHSFPTSIRITSVVDLDSKKKKELDSKKGGGGLLAAITGGKANLRKSQVGTFNRLCY
jgi:hypothetical protein